ncbi:hypothetical protein SK128_003036, partial [Halocaridina rubra]
YKNVTEVQRQFRRQFHKDPPMPHTIALIRDKFEADGTVQDVHKQCSGRSRTSTSPTREEELVEMLLRSQKNP